MQQAIHRPTDPKASHPSCLPFSARETNYTHSLDAPCTVAPLKGHSSATTRNAYPVGHLFRGAWARLHWRLEGLAKHGSSPELTFGGASALCESGPQNRTFPIHSEFSFEAVRNALPTPPPPRFSRPASPWGFFFSLFISCFN